MCSVFFIDIKEKKNWLDRKCGLCVLVFVQFSSFCFAKLLMEIWIFCDLFFFIATPFFACLFVWFHPQVFFYLCVPHFAIIQGKPNNFQILSEKKRSFIESEQFCFCLFFFYGPIIIFDWSFFFLLGLEFLAVLYNNYMEVEQSFAYCTECFFCHLV